MKSISKTLLLLGISIFLNTQLHSHNPDESASDKKKYAKNIRKEFFKKENLQYLCLKDHKGLKNKSIALIEYYQIYVSPNKGFRCAYGAMNLEDVSCSEYGKQAIQEHGVVKGMVLLRKRMEGCRTSFVAYQEIQTKGDTSVYCAENKDNLNNLLHCFDITCCLTVFMPGWEGC